MAFGRRGRDVEPDEEFDEEEVELVLFQGAVNGAQPNLRKHGRLVDAGLVPAKELVTDAIARRAETVVVEPRGNVAAVKLEVDGVAYPGGRIRKQHALAVTQMLKLLAGLDIAEKKRPQKGGLRAEYQDEKYLLVIESTPISGGVERLTIRSRLADSGLDKPDTIGFSAEMKQQIREVAGPKSGLVAACGPPHSGVSTTEIGLLRSADAYVYSVVTIADAKDEEIANVSRFETLEGDDLPTTLARIIRTEHNVVHVDPLTEAETARTLLEHADQLCFVTEFAARDAAHGVAQLVKWAGNPELVADRVLFVVSQKLLRTLCEECKFAYRPHPKLLARVGLPKETKLLYRPPLPTDLEEDEEEPEICDHCGGLNYFGRTAIFEMIEMTDGMKEVLRAGADPKAIKAQARKEDMLTFQKDGLRLVVEGKTSLEELQRIFSAGGKKRPKRRA